MMSDTIPKAPPSNSATASLATQLPFHPVSTSAPHLELKHEETTPLALSESHHNPPPTEATRESPSALTSMPTPASSQPPTSHAQPSHQAPSPTSTSDIIPTPLLIEPKAQARPQKHAASEEAEAKQIHPHLLRKTSHMESDYMHMVLALDDISIFYNMAAGFFTWILLAGFVLFPGTFPNLQAKAEQHKLPVNSPIVLDAVTRVTSLPLFIVAWACTGIGILGMLWLTWRWRKNYIWALNKVFLPGLLNSLAGLLSTLASIYGSQDGEFTRPSRITLIVLVSCSGVCLILVAIYALWFIRRIKNKHDKEVGLERAGKYGEGITVDVKAAREKKNAMKEKQQV